MPQFPDPVEPPPVFPKADLKLTKEDLEKMAQMPDGVTLIMPAVTTQKELDAVFADALSKLEKSTRDNLEVTWDGATCKVATKGGGKGGKIGGGGLEGEIGG